MRFMLRSLFVVCLALALTFPAAADDQQLAQVWVRLGAIENPVAHCAFVVHREVKKENQLYLLTAHELIAIQKMEDGSMLRTYRDEPCVIFVDENRNNVFEPNERRWKQPNDHSCDVARLPGSIDMAIDEVAKTIALLWHAPAPKPQRETRHAFTAIADKPQAVVWTQLPDLPIQ